MRLSAVGITRSVGAAGAGAGLVLGAMHLPSSWTLGALDHPSVTSPSAEPAHQVVREAALDCPGPELEGVRGVSDVRAPGTLSAAPAPAQALPGVSLPAAKGTLTLGTLGAPASASSSARPMSTSVGYSSAQPLHVSATESLAPGLAATQEWVLGSTTARGLGSTPCGAASAEAWLLGGGGQAGRQERLVLSNPGANPVTVDLTLHGAKGPVDSPNGHDVLVPARGRTSVLLDSISATEVSPAVHVVAQGGVVRAALNDYWLDGTLPAGSDDSAPAATPSRAQVIPGVSLVGTGALRVLVPGGHDGVVQARFLTPTGRVALPRGGVKRVQAGATADFDLSGMPPGAYAVQVTADVPVTTAATVVRRKDKASVGDFAWAPSTEAITGTAGVPFVPQAGKAPAVKRRLSLASTGGAASAEVTTVSASGAVASRPVAVPADGSTSVDVSGAASVWVRRARGAGGVHAAVISTSDRPDGQLVSVLPLVDAPALRVATQLVRLPD